MILIDAVKSSASITQCPRPYNDLKRLSQNILKRLQENAFCIAQMEAAIVLAVGSTRSTERQKIITKRLEHEKLQTLEFDIKTQLDGLDNVLKERERRDKIDSDP